MQDDLVEERTGSFGVLIGDGGIGRERGALHEGSHPVRIGVGQLVEVGELKRPVAQPQGDEVVLLDMVEPTGRTCQSDGAARRDRMRAAVPGSQLAARRVAHAFVRQAAPQVQVPVCPQHAELKLLRGDHVSQHRAVGEGRDGVPAPFGLEHVTAVAELLRDGVLVLRDAHSQLGGGQGRVLGQGDEHRTDEDGVVRRLGRHGSQQIRCQRVSPELPTGSAHRTLAAPASRKVSLPVRAGGRNRGCAGTPAERRRRRWAACAGTAGWC